MKTITALGRQYGLSRTTLLYYDRLKLLSPTYRTGADARLYSDSDEAKLGQIVTYRKAGIPLESIRRMLESAPGHVNQRLEKRLAEIQQQIGALRAQQRFVVEMLKDAVLRGERPARDRKQWVQLLRACDFTDQDMRAWHVAMERDNPKGHARFLKNIGFSSTEAADVRARARERLTAQATPSASAAKP